MCLHLIGVATAPLRLVDPSPEGDPEAFGDLGQLVMTSELLPDENPELLPRPDRVEHYELSETFDVFGELMAGIRR